MKDYITITEKQIKRLENLKQRYEALYTEPEACQPMIIINVENRKEPSWAQKLADPLVMLKSQMDNIKNHFVIEDDYYPAVRVDFGTGQIGSAFGCDIHFPEDNLPAVCSHPLKNIEDIYNTPLPSLDAGLYAKVFDWIEIWRQNIPKWLQIQHPDIQSPFNNAHLIRGNDIFLDFYDNPKAVQRLLDVITDYTIKVVKNINEVISANNGWFCDWNGAYWKGGARISNCSSDMISPELYSRYVLPRDIRLLRTIGGGRVHYCGGHFKVIEEFFKNPEVTGLDIDAGLHDVWDIAAKSPDKMVLAIENYGRQFAQLERLLKGDFPPKRNFIIYSTVHEIEEAKELIAHFRKICGNKYKC